MASTRDRINAQGQYVGTSVLWREDGKQRSRLFPSSAEAIAYRAKVECGTADTSPAARGAILFGVFVLTVWLPSCGKARRTVNTMRSAMANGLAPLANQTLAWVAQHRAEVQALIAADSSVDHGRLYMTVKGACEEAVALGLIESHRLSGIKVKRSGKRRDIILTTPEQRQHIADGLGQHSLAVWIMHGTGCRISECLGLRGSDFRDGFRTVRIQRQSDDGMAAPLKARREGQFRDVPVPTWLAKMVKAHVAEHGLGPMFPGRSKEFTSYESVQGKIKTLASELGLDGFTAHQFRHHFATALLANHMDIVAVAEWLGDGVKVVQETYAHVLPVASDRAREILDMAL
jgi:integrase